MSFGIARLNFGRISRPHLNLIASIGEPCPSLSELGIENISQLEARLGEWRLRDDANNELKGYLASDFRRFLYTLYLVPDGEGRLLELGANPYFITRLLKWYRKYSLTLANFFESPDSWGQQPGVNERTGESEIFDCDLFNCETASFPYPNESFNVVLLCEILEHLQNDPVWTISEIHRVLKPGGHLILTTPNVARFENCCRLLRGENLYDPYSGYGPYGRHNREYTIGEARHILYINGFDIERSFTADVKPNQGTGQPTKLQGLVSTITKERENDLGEYIFIRAVKARECNQVRTHQFFRSRNDLVSG